ncbi:ArgK/MeaB family GTPase [Roseixanthobacter glucoisosaccharinicivorans]|uniref:ArgK/MeaB family GTPase n=1 Tax=Roseixanthobacter glucoisosaccharinicivorans TaxID=3119923 RepID=UPI00372A0404
MSAAPSQPALGQSAFDGPPLGEAPLDRRALGRALSRAADAGVADILDAPPRVGTRYARRIGVTGPPGAGKSTLIAALARHRLERADRVAIVAIDPSSPKTQGSILGDRIRMDGLVDDPRVFIRSLASRGATDGLADNLPEILSVFDDYDFDEIILETVGVGQSEFAVRALVDIELLVLIPGAGDQIQAMKAGILETADIYVVNKADQPGARRVEAELKATLALTTRSQEPPPVICVRADAGENIAALDHAIEALAVRKASDAGAALRRRACQRVKGLVWRRLAEVLEALPQSAFDQPLPALYAALLEDLHQGKKR